jgi:hypothetical protein
MPLFRANERHTTTLEWRALLEALVRVYCRKQTYPHDLQAFHVLVNEDPRQDYLGICIL